MTVNPPPPQAPQPQTVKPRRRRWLRYAALVLLLVLAAPAVFYWYTAWSLKGATARAVAETEAVDPRWRLDQIEADRKTYDPDKNSALYVTKVAALIANGSPANNRAYNDVFADLLPQHQLTPQQSEMIRAAFENLGGPLTEARKLKDMPGGRFPLKLSPDYISTLLPDQQNARRVTDVLHHDVMLLAQNGDPDRAVQSCLALVNAANSLGDEPFLISFLIRAAGETLTIASVERILAQGFPSAGPLAELQRRLAQEEDNVRRHWVSSIRGERAGHQQLFEAMAAGKVTFSQVAGMAGTPSPLERLLDQFPVVVTKDYPEHLRHLNEIVAAAQLPNEQQLDKLSALEQAVAKKGVLTRLLMPASQRVAQTNLRIQAQLAAAQAAIASERFRIAHKRWPESLDELVKAALLDAIPRDPIDGAPLRFRRLADGLVIYSVGPDKQDNQGTLHRERWLEEGGDWGMRVWDAARRRQPPPPFGNPGGPP